MLLDKNGNNIKMNPTALSGRSMENPLAIMERIVSQFKDKSRKDIQKWRTAITVAENPENPRRDLLMDLLDDLQTDGHLTSQIEQRKSATLNTPFQVINKKTGEVDIDKTDFFQASWFYEVLSAALDSLFYGHSLIEFISFDENKIDVETIPRRNVVPNTKTIVPDWSNAENTIDYSEPQYEGWLLEFGKKDDLGLLNKIVPNLIWKRNVMQTWAEFCERFGIPLITGTTLKQDPETLDLIEGMLEQLGEAAHAVFPEGTTIDIKEANRADAYQVFDNKISRNNEEISKAITGGTMLSDNGSSKSQSEVHERNLEKRLAPADRRNITFIVNDNLIPLLIDKGYPFTEDDTFAFDTTQQLSLSEHWKIVKEVLDKYEIDGAWIAKTFNVPITGERQTQQPTLPAQAIAPEITAVLEDNAFSATGVSFPIYAVDACCENHDRWSPLAAYQDDMDELHNELYNNVYNGKNTLTQEAKITALEGLRLLSALKNGWGERAITAAFNEPDHLMLSMMEFNLFEFASSKTEARLASLSQLLIDKDKMGIRNFNDFKVEASKITEKFNTSWLRTEYNLSVAVGQNSAAFSRALAEQEIIPYVQYITAGDENVRSSHQLLNNRIFSLSDKTAMNLWPPNGYGCRCEMIQYPHTPTKGSITSGASGSKQLGDGFKASQFNINRGDLKQVFTKKQFYHDIKGLPDKIDSMDYKKTYGLADYSKIKKGLNTIKLDKSITPDNINELFKIDGKQGKNPFMGFDDYLKRKIILKKTVFDSHTTGKHITSSELRHQMFPHIQSVLNNADEVWMHSFDRKKFQVRYIKFYGDMAFIVDTDLGKNNLEIKTWHQLKTKDKDKRNGMLIRKRED